MKKTLIIALIIGVFLGIAQARVTTEDTRTIKAPVYSDECGSLNLCFPEVVGYRDEQISYNDRQGFPISKPGVHEFNLTHMDTLHYQTPLIANFFIFVLGVPLLAFLGYRLLHKESKSNR